MFGAFLFDLGLNVSISMTLSFVRDNMNHWADSYQICKNIITVLARNYFIG